MNKIINFIKYHIDFKFHLVSVIALLTGLSVIPMLLYMPQKYGVENGLLENIQMCVLFVTMYLCLSAKYNKRFFKFAALALTLIMIREVNCGRTLFFPKPNTYHEYYRWRELPWPWLGKSVHTVYGIWIGIVALLFFVKGFCVDFVKIIKNVKFPFWNLIFMGFASFMGAIAEKLTNNNTIFEEGFELLFYVSLLGVVWLYSRNEQYMAPDYIEKENTNTLDQQHEDE